MILDFDLVKPVFILPAGFNAKALLPSDMHEHAGSLEFLMHLVAVNRGGALDFAIIDRVTGGPLMTEYLFAVLVDNGIITPQPNPQENSRVAIYEDEESEAPKIPRPVRTPRHIGRVRHRRRLTR